MLHVVHVVQVQQKPALRGFECVIAAAGGNYRDRSTKSADPDNPGSPHAKQKHDANKKSGIPSQQRLDIPRSQHLCRTHALMVFPLEKAHGTSHFKGPGPMCGIASLDSSPPFALDLLGPRCCCVLLVGLRGAASGPAMDPPINLYKP